VSLPELRGARVRLRPADPEADAAPLAAILAEPEVSRWWNGPYDADRTRRELLEEEPGWIIEAGGELVGWVQYFEETDPDYRHVALDITLAAAVHGQGLGPEALRLVVDHFAAAGHHRFTIDPAAHNDRAIRAYAKVGFKPVGRLRDYERGPDGTWHDGLLMDLLVSELPPAS
jgi:aminoglycoside 6'-N-acetyltransferase